MGIFSRFRKNEQKNNSESVSLSPKEKFKKMVPANPGIALNDDEVCLFMSDASIGKEKTHTTGYKSSGISSRIRIAKGLSVGSSNVHVTHIGKRPPADSLLQTRDSLRFPKKADLI